jgi:nucleotide-binding universal stress UspA family protein
MTGGSALKTQKPEEDTTMAAKSQTLIVVPIDGSENSLRSLDYINLMFGSNHHLKVTVFHVLPSLPSVLIEEGRKNAKIGEQLQNLKKKDIELAERLLMVAKNKLVKLGFSEQAVETVYKERRVGIARDICNWAQDHRADALVISSRGRTRIQAFFTGEIANKVLEYSKTCPIWMIKGSVKNGDVLLAVDHSENALRAVNHCGFMLSGAGANVMVFHANRDLRSFIPKEVVEEFPEFNKFFSRKAGAVVAPYLKKSKEMLLKAGLTERRVKIKVIDGSRNTARDILDKAHCDGIGTVVLGKRGSSNVKDFSMGSIARKVLDGAMDMAICMVP